MDRIIKTIAKRLLLLFVCSMGIVILLAREFSHGVLSSHAFEVGLLIVAVGMGVSAMVIVTKTAKELRGVTGPPGTALDEITRRRRLLGIRAGKAMIALLTIALVFGLFRGGPLVPVLVGIAMNLVMMLSLIWWVVRLQRSLH
jgi:hypothetical protein